MSRRPILWEENEEYQRAQAWFISLVFVVVCCAGLALYAWGRNWDGVLWVASIVGATALGVVAWAGLMALLIYGGLGAARLWRTLRAARGGNP